MVRALMRIVVALLIFIAGVAPLAWGEVRQVTILYSNNINGQIYPAG